MAESYNRDYFLNECDGFRQYRNSKGHILGKRQQKVLDLADIRSGAIVLDIGCGRGEIILHCARAGAQTWGIDHSSAATRLSRETLDHWSAQERFTGANPAVVQGDCRQLAFMDGVFTVVILSDLVEHISQADLKQTLIEVKRVLKPGGRVVIHTSPNRFYIPLMGRLLALLAKMQNRQTPGTFRSIPWNIRPLLPAGLQKNIHLNEQSSFSLKHNLRKAGLKPEIILFELNPHYIDRLFNDSSIFKKINRLRTFIPIKHLFYADLFVVATA